MKALYGKKLTFSASKLHKITVTVFLYIEKWPKSFTIVPYRGPLLEKFVEQRVIVPYRGPLLVPYSGPLLVPYNGPPLYVIMKSSSKILENSFLNNEILQVTKIRDIISQILLSLYH